ncbi:MAG: inverse autotransporter beta domain-containing protein [Verrucomicrobiales bacterium]
MKLTFLVILAGAFGATLLQAGPTELGKEMVTEVPEASWGDYFGGGAKSNGDFTEGSYFAVVPLLNTLGKNGSMEGTVFFVEPYGTWAEGENWVAPWEWGCVISSVNNRPRMPAVGPVPDSSPKVFPWEQFVSRLRQHRLRRRFLARGIGVEAGTRYLEMRANYYLPFSDDHTISRRTETDIVRYSRTDKKTVTGPPYTSGGQIVQNVTRKSTTRTTTRTTRTTYELFEEGLEGWDLEAALLVPGIDQFCEVKLIGGYYSFSGERSQIEIDGWRAGIEARPVPALVLHATWFESDRLYQDNWLAGFRLEVPLDGNLRQAFTPGRRHLAERLFEPVHRKNSALTTNGAEEEEVSTTQTSSTSQTTTTSTTGNVIGSLAPPERT